MNIKEQKIANIKRMIGLDLPKSINSKDIDFVDLAITSRCNINCALCQTTLVHDGKIPIVDLDINVLKNKILTREQTRNFKMVICCGSFGDPMMYKWIDELIDHFIDVGPHLFLQFNTNGSMRKTEWWTNLGKTFKDYNYHVQFGIDGFEDTHSKYRIGSNFNTVMEHMMAYINAGGKAVWQFIIFDYNEHQVNRAEQICREHDIRFQPIMSYKYCEGFGRPKDWRIGWLPGRLNCKTIDDKSIYVDENGYLTPCCFTNPANKMYYNEKQLMLLDKESINLNNVTLEEAMDSDFFKYTVKNRDDIGMCSFFCKGQKRFEAANKKCKPLKDPFHRDAGSSRGDFLKKIKGKIK